jgi:microcompartment protein CcmK/EutM
MFVNLVVSNLVSDAKDRSVTHVKHFAIEDVSSGNSPNRVVLQPGLTFRNITNNTREPMDITGIIETLDKQLATRLC